MAINQTRRPADHQATCAPIREIEMQVEPSLHQLGRIALEVAPLIRVRKSGGGDPGPGRQGSQGRLIGLAEGVVDGLKFVILVFAHGRRRSFLGRMERRMPLVSRI